MSKQLPLNLQLKTHYDRDHFILASANVMAAETLDTYPDWPAQVMVLVGPNGSGKTHLAHIWAAEAGAELISGSDYNEASSANLHGYNFVIDGLIDNENSQTFDEVALFHLLNSARQNQTFGLITSRNWPKAWNLQLPDLKSRLKAAPLLEIFEPDDAFLLQVMHKLFADKQITVDHGVIEYLVQRMERSLSTAQSLVNHLDKEALAQGRKITKPMASLCLERISQSAL
jgi:chromosomal replication initiation ATPase DnaA